MSDKRNGWIQSTWWLARNERSNTNRNWNRTQWVHKNQGLDLVGLPCTSHQGHFDEAGEDGEFVISDIANGKDESGNEDEGEELRLRFACFSQQAETIVLVHQTQSRDSSNPRNLHKSCGHGLVAYATYPISRRSDDSHFVFFFLLKKRKQKW